MTEKSDRERAEEILKPVPHDEFAKKVADKRFTYYASIGSRLGFNTLASMVEYRIFHPNVGPESNDDYLFMRLILDEIPFFVFGVPFRFEPQVKELAEAILMRISRGYPTIVSAAGPVFFPGHRAAETGRYNLYSVENTSGSLVYLNKPNIRNLIDQRERELVDALVMYGHQLPLDLIRDYLWLRDSQGQA